MKNVIFILVLLLTDTACLFAQREVFVKSEEAIQGYDPVSYFVEHMPVKGKDEFSFMWKDAVWKFSSAANLDAFKTDPEKYAPQFGGYCAYGMMEGHKAPTSADAWTIVDGKLYLNYNKNVQTLWNKNQQENITKAVTNWPAVKLHKD